MIKKSLLISITFLFFNAIHAQQIEQTFKGKTHMMSEEEFLKLKTVGKDFIETDPPVGDIRSIAEFERTEGIIVTFLNYSSTSGYFGVPESLIAEISEDVIVYTVVENSTVENTVKDIYTSNNVNLNNVVFVYSESDSYWSRDYSPWFIANDNHVSIVNFPYNRPRPNDNDMPIVFGNQLGLDVYGMNLISTGGNYMSDGMGVAASCDLVYEENPDLTVQNVSDLAQNYLGINTYHLLDDPLDDYIEHIDCWGKFLDVDKILITKVAESDYRFADFEAIADYWANQISSYGNKYQVYRVYSPNGQPYTNSLILNNKVMVPIVSGFGSDYNNDALQVYQNAMPGYEIIGFEQTSGAPWESTDALHCRTHEVPDMEMLYIKHFALNDSLDYSATSSEISADIISYTGNEIQNAKLFYKINDAGFTSKNLLNEAMPNTYSATIDNLFPGDSVFYYIEATDELGKTEYHPLIGESDPHKFYVKSQAVSVLESEENQCVSIFPNPANEFVILAFSNMKNYEVNYSISDLYGRIVFKGSFYNNENWKKNRIDIQSLIPGVYLLNVFVNSKQITNKLIVN